MKKNNFLMIISLLTLVIAVIGATFSFFRVMTGSESGAVAVEAARLNINLTIRPMFNAKPLLPLNNSDIIKAYNSECVDYLDRGACDAYIIRIDNEGQDMEYIGSIKFVMNGLTNLNYMVLNEDDTIYKDITEISSDSELSLGEEFSLVNMGARIFKLIIWIPNLDKPQEDDDAAGTYNASVTYSSTAGSKVTGTFSH